ncbi:LysR family transcriptional regulator [Cystobacter fuscus]|uniref:LysR family transcriptional regulator n=1 Tax=Cystobacter fuscus TaxID=43 RepID=A0A250J1J4_9BACT|nr:LysR family transcriptional regulator [Cystobacter fuscus]ATB37036.1 LysR family transcriptional regulator [Cystobacter fuscus]
MLDAVTLDQLRTFIAVVDEGSFSSAGRKLKRVQSAVSHAMANLETQLGVRVWDRSTKIPTLTEEGRVLLASARRICAEVDSLRRVAEALVSGLEPSVSLVVDAILPVRALVDLCKEFAVKFPTVQLRLYTDTLSGVSARVFDGSCQVGVVGPAASAQGLARQHLTSVRMIPVVAREHPLAKVQGRLTTQALAEYVHIVLSERDGMGRTEDQAILSSNTWRVADLSTKHALLLAGLGWGNMPEHLVKDDLARGRLVRLETAAWGEDTWLLSLSVVHRPELAKGPATRWLLQRMAELCSRELGHP